MTQINDLIDQTVTLVAKIRFASYEMKSEIASSTNVETAAARLHALARLLDRTGHVDRVGELGRHAELLEVFKAGHQTKANALEADLNQLLLQYHSLIEEISSLVGESK